MARFRARYEFAHDADCIYAILSDVEGMREFMPLCKQSEVVSRRTTLEAEAVVANVLLRHRQLGFERAFDLDLIFRPQRREIEAATREPGIVSGSARCTVTETGRGAARLDIEGEVRPASLVLRLLVGRRLLLHGVERIMDRLRQRAETLQGP